MKALDLFCGAGGASKGLADAGFDVTGVDLIEHKEYPFRFFKADALMYDWNKMFEFDLVWASPPCQKFTAYKRNKGHVKARENLIPRVREILKRLGKPYIIENVVGAPLIKPIQLCGSMFGLDVQRHRIFETSFYSRAPECDHTKWKPRFPPATNRKNMRKTVEVGVWRIPMDIQSKAMGIDWMNREQLSQAIPPSYSHFIAKQFLFGLGLAETMFPSMKQLLRGLGK